MCVCVNFDYFSDVDILLQHDLTSCNLNFFLNWLVTFSKFTLKFSWLQPSLISNVNKPFIHFWFQFKFFFFFKFFLVGTMKLNFNYSFNYSGMNESY